MAAWRPAHDLAFFMLGRPYSVVAAHDTGVFMLLGLVLGAFAHDLGDFMLPGPVLRVFTHENELIRARKEVMRAMGDCA